MEEFVEESSFPPQTGANGANSALQPLLADFGFSQKYFNLFRFFFAILLLGARHVKLKKPCR